MSEEYWSPADATLYWEWCDVWYEPGFNFDTDLNEVGEEILAKAERLGPPPDWTRYGDSPEDVPVVDGTWVTW